MSFISVKEEQIGDFRTKDIYIYGHGESGVQLCALFERHQIRVKKFVADDAYVNQADVDEISMSEYQKLDGDKALFFGFGAAAVPKISSETDIYYIFNVFGFWKWNADYDSSENAERIKNGRDFLADERSKKTLDTYLAAMRSGEADADAENVMAERCFNELTKDIDRDRAYVDVGAYTGDTIQMFRNYYQDFRGEIYGFEPDAGSFEILRQQLGDIPNIRLYPCGIWECSGEISFTTGNGQRSEVSGSGNTTIHVESIDTMFRDTWVSYIKIGNDFWKEIIRGAENVIRRDRPYISMFACYSFEMLYEVAEYFARLAKDGIEYRLYLRHHGVYTSGLLFFYAVPVNR